MMKITIPIIAAGLLFVFLFPGTAFAYLDPGSGSMIVQGILAIFAAACVSAGIFWRKLKAFLGSQKTHREERDGDEF